MIARPRHIGGCLRILQDGSDRLDRGTHCFGGVRDIQLQRPLEGILLRVPLCGCDGILHCMRQQILQAYIKQGWWLVQGVTILCTQTCPPNASAHARRSPPCQSPECGLLHRCGVRVAHQVRSRLTSRASMVEMKGLPCLSVDVVIALKKRLRRSLASNADTPTPALRLGRVGFAIVQPQQRVQVDAKAVTQHLLPLISCTNDQQACSPITLRCGATGCDLCHYRVVLCRFAITAKARRTVAVVLHGDGLALQVAAHLLWQLLPEAAFLRSSNAQYEAPPQCCMHA